MSIGWPQAIFLVLTLLGSGRAMALYGESKKPDTYDEVDVVIAPAVLIGLLWWGGFFG